MGSRISTMKITITQDVVDSGTRKIVEDIQVKKYSDYEVFSFSQVIKQMRRKLDPEVFLRVHMIYNLTYDLNVFESERVRADKEQYLEDS